MTTETGNRVLIERMRAAYATGDQGRIEQAALEFWSDDTIDEFPQSGEQFQGRSSATALAAAYDDATGTHPSFAVREIRGRDDFWVVEGTIDYGNGAKVFAVTIVELAEGRIARQTDYFASPFEAPEWRRPYWRTAA